jgi:hypothetical protein
MENISDNCCAIGSLFEHLSAICWKTLWFSIDWRESLNSRTSFYDAGIFVTNLRCPDRDQLHMLYSFDYDKMENVCFSTDTSIVIHLELLRNYIKTGRDKCRIKNIYESVPYHLRNQQVELYLKLL